MYDLYVCMIYMYVCMHACMYVCTPVCMYSCMYVCMYSCMYSCMSVLLYACMYVLLYVCMYVYTSACMYVRMIFMYVFICALLRFNQASERCDRLFSTEPNKRMWTSMGIYLHSFQQRYTTHTLGIPFM